MSEVCDSLLVWLSQFHDEEGGEFVADDLTDGHILADVLSQIAPAWFDFKDNLKDNVGGNWRLKVSNLRRIKNSIMDYYAEVLEMDLLNFPEPDCNLIGEKADDEHLSRLLQLVLGCAVHCDDKEEIVKRIMMMEQKQQTVVMQCIQELMGCEVPRSMGGHDYERKLLTSNSELEQALREDYDSQLKHTEEYKQKVHELQLDLQIQREANEGLQTENERLLLKCKNDESMSNVMNSQGSGDHNMSQLVENFQAERYQLELARDDYRIKCETFENEIAELTERCVELQEQASNSKRLKDEVDELNYRLTNTAKLEQQVETYKKKLEEIPELKQQVKSLEAQIDSYVMEKVSLEDENKKQNIYKTQLEKYKVDIRRLQDELMSETKRADKCSIESERYRSKCEAIESDNFNLLQERASLKENLETLQYSSNKDNSLNEFLDQDGTIDNSGPVSAQVKETIARLQLANKNLKTQLSEQGITDTDIELLREDLKENKDYQKKIEEELREANQRIAVLESDVKISNNTTTPTQELMQLQDALSQEKARHRDSVEMMEKKNSRIKELEPRVKSAAEAINSLKDIIKKKDDEIKAQEEKYKRFLGKAKQVIKAIDPKTSQSPSPDTAALRKQLAEKEKALTRMEDEAKNLKSVREREERMVLSAWYEMGMHVHKKGLEERFQPQVSSPRSLLSQKRNEMRRSTVSGKSGSSPQGVR